VFYATLLRRKGPKKTAAQLRGAKLNTEATKRNEVQKRWPTRAKNLKKFYRNSASGKEERSKAPLKKPITRKIIWEG